MVEFKSKKYGAWTIRVRKTRINKASPFFYEYKVELYGEDISRGWISVPYGADKHVAVAYAIEAINTNYKKTTLISEHGGVLRQKYDQFRGSIWG